MVRLKSTEKMDVFHTTTGLSKQDFTENKESYETVNKAVDL